MQHADNGFGHLHSVFLSFAAIFGGFCWRGWVTSSNAYAILPAEIPPKPRFRLLEWVF
jgi:hypothetical protein